MQQPDGLPYKPSWLPSQVRPTLSDTGFEAEAYGAAQHYPMPPPDRPFTQSTVIAWHSHYDRIAGKVDTVAKGDTPSTLRYGAVEIAPMEIADYLAHNPVTSFAVARDDAILSEHYLYARTDRDRFLSNSMAKSITGLLVGIALSDGAIHGERTFVLAGRFSQWVFVDPTSRLVMAQTAVETKTVEDAPTSVTYDLWRTLLSHTQ
ncbi:MAG TPA: hypothetical protein VGJ56_10810 [Reyranella sp.]